MRRASPWLSRVVPVGLVCLASLVGLDAFQNRGQWPPAVRKTPDKAPVLSAEEEMKTMVLPPGYRVELVAKEPLVVDPIAIDFDADGRMWVLEMQGFMSEPGGANSREPINTVAVLEDENGDGVMDKRTVFADKLVLPRALKVLDAGVLVGEPPNLWLMKDTNGDLKADTQGARQRFVRPRRRQHRAQRQQPALGARQHHLHVRARVAPAAPQRQVRDDAGAAPRPVGGVDGRRRAGLSQRQRRAAVRRFRRARSTTRGIPTWSGRAASTTR